MEKQVSEQLTERLSVAKSALAFMFNPDGTVQGFASGDAHELMATIATEMSKSPFIKMVIEGSIEIFKNGKVQQS